MAGLGSVPPADGARPLAEKNIAETFEESDLTIRDQGVAGVIDGSLSLNDPDPIFTFEDGTTAPDHSEWNDWTGNTGRLSVQQGTVLGGDYTAEFYSDNETVSISSTRSSEAQIEQFVFRMMLDTNSGAYGGDYDDKLFRLLDGSGNAVAQVYVLGEGQVTDGSGDSYNQYDSISIGEEHRFMFRLDYSTEEYEIWVDGELLATEPFENSAAGIGEFYVHNHTNYTNNLVNLYLDAIGRTDPEATAGSPVLEWPHPPDLFAWDSLSFGSSPGNGSVEVYVEESTDNGSTWTEIAGPVERGDSIPASADALVRFRVDISRPSTSDDPTLDYLARRWTY